MRVGEAPGQQRLYGVASFVNSVGTGFYYPLSLLLIAHLLDSSLSDAGVLLTVSALAAIPFIFVTGPLVTRLGSRNCLLLTLGIRCVCFALLPFAATHALIGLLCFAIVLAGRVEQSAVQILALDAPMDVTETPAWLAWWRTGFTAGYGVGTVSAGISLTLVTFPIEIVAVVNAASFAAAGLLFSRIEDCANTRANAVNEAASTERQGTIGVVQYYALAWTAAVLGGASLLVESTLAPYLLQRSVAPDWAAGGLLAINCVLVAGLMAPFERLHRGRKQTWVAVLGCLLTGLGIAPLAAVSGWDSAAILMMGLSAAMAVFSIGEVLWRQSVSVLLVVLPPRGGVGTRLGVSQLISAITAACVPLLAGILVDAGSPVAWIAVSMVPALCVPLILLPSVRRGIDTSMPDIVLRQTTSG